MSHFCYIPKKHCRTLTVECFVMSCMQNLHISTFRPVYGRSSKRKNWRGMGPIWLRREHFLLKDSLPLHWVQLRHLWSNRWPDLVTGGQLKGWISVLLSNLWSACLGQITCYFCFWKIKPWYICVSQFPNLPPVFSKSAILVLGI